ncbi:hypothetical protein Taro_000138 [Colocasia esculenta]|uniref:Uncharacterized protein n=1 Tax=Colocasia esculenta TaxID=4460 RepID=A0A843TFT8_COLES|nr:hypothetical protein [Colocasia esculenta]
MKCGVFLYVYTDCGLVSLARLRPVRGRRTRIKCVISLTGLAEAFRHSCYQRKVRARRTFPVRRPVLDRVVAEQGQYLQRSSTQQCSLVVL